MAKESQEKKPSINQLLQQLKGATEQGEKRKLRARLRAAGHTGGLGEGGGRKKAPAKKAANAPAKGRRAKPAATPAAGSQADAG